MKASDPSTFVVPATALPILLTLAQYISCIYTVPGQQRCACAPECPVWVIRIAPSGVAVALEMKILRHRSRLKEVTGETTCLRARFSR